ncbi:lasso peptide biosynthesis PqqD family chaperone [Paenibacillus favisporus]|uniref:lasso peptide biosynthesis PqqD family chaperone n=1 Tax=Paenibacillus favisporus TaxID=221028 RepID=UPI002DBA898A|nr:lasso peptide biosynthesis PqqD family chaperone [Paenibacillus favisporus]MEC0178121.1 lasso peptide biosynthesis PqqD family chaperone [Paenibacillus favisporus]
MSMTEIAAANIISQSPGYLVSDMDGEKVMLSIETGKYYNLGQIGGRIWELIAAPISLTDLVGQLVEEYDIGPEACEQQVHPFLNKLAAEGLIQVRSGHELE